MANTENMRVQRGTSYQERTKHSGHQYQKVKAALTVGLSEGRWMFGEAVPSESQLARQFSVSVGTVRRAIDELVAEGILVRQHGRGTFVASHTNDYLFNIFFRIVDGKGLKQRTSPRLLSFRRAFADAATASNLRIPVGAAIYRIFNVLLLNNRTIACDDIRLPQRLFPGLTREELAQRDQTVYGVLQRRYGVDTVWAKELLSAVKAGSRVGELLGVKTNMPILRLQRTAYSYQDSAIEFRFRYINTADHYYLSLLGRATVLE